MKAAQFPIAAARKSHLLVFPSRCFQILVTCWLFMAAAVAKTQPSLIDNFASDTTLNSALWTSAATDYLKSAALYGEGGRQCSTLANNFVKPNLSFGSGGMQMSGVNGWTQFTGIQSLNTFAPPFTFETTVTGTVANGNPFEIYFISADGKQVFSVYGNVNPANVPYVGIKVGCQVIYATPSVNVAYTIDISATADGAFGVALRTGSTILTTQTFQIEDGPPYGPFYLILGQGEGWPNTGKTENVAVWQSVALQPTAGSGPSSSSAPPDNSIWVAQAQAAADGKTAGTITLKWNFSGASNCKLSVNPMHTLSTLQDSVPVACTNTQGGWSTYLPNPQGRQPVRYLFSITGSGIPVRSPSSVSAYALPRLTYGSEGLPFSSLIRYPEQGPCASAAFPQGNCWWPFGYSDAECSPSGSGCQSYSAKSKGRASAGILGFGIIGSGQVQDSIMVIYGNTFSIPAGYAEHLLVNTDISYNGLGGCFAILGGDAVDFQIAVTDNLSPVADAVAPVSAPNTICLEAGLGPISAFLKGSITAAQLLAGSPQLLSAIDSLEQAYTSNNIAGDFEQLTNVLSDLGALGNVSLTTTPSNYVTNSWTPIALSPCVYRLMVIPTVALRDFGAGLVGGQLLETTSSVAISGIAVPAAGTESACYAPR